MKQTRHYIRILLLVLLLGGMVNGAWAQTTYKVTYHVITLPYCNENTNHVVWRIEALKTTVTYSNTEDFVELPDQFKSPLMTDDAYSYYTDVNRTAPSRMFPDNGSTYRNHDFNGKTPFYAGDGKKKISDLINPSSGATLVGGVYHVYVTYDWANKKSALAQKIDINGNKIYNIGFRYGGKTWFYAMNMEDERGNRAQAIPSADVKDLAELCTNGPHKALKVNESRYNFHYTWKLVNNDPYNIILQTAYEGDFQHKENNYWKMNINAQFYGKVNNSTSAETSTWMTNEVNHTYTSKNFDDVTFLQRQGWFRGGGDSYGVGTNGVSSNLYFSFSLLNHPTANYTLVASWVDVNGNDWVPNSSNHYLHIGRKNSKYPGATYSTFADADQVQLWEVRDYTYKVKTPLSKTVLEAPLKWSDYAKDTLLINRVPNALKRKYIEFTGAFNSDALTAGQSRTTFENLVQNDEENKKKNRDIWLEYRVSASIPFKLFPGTATLDQLKWYNVYANKEEKYTAWYENSGDTDTPVHTFNTNDPSTSSGHTKYAHESHFAFIGDPYELYVVNRLANENATDNKFNFLKLSATNTDNLSIGKIDEFNDIPKASLVPGNTYYTTEGGGGKFIATGNETGTFYKKNYQGVSTLEQGKTYYTSTAGDGEFKILEPVAGGKYYVKEFNEVHFGKKLTAGQTYYTSPAGEGEFVATGTEEANGGNYYRAVYSAVPDSMTLSPGCVYYTSPTGGGKFTAGSPVTAGENQYHIKAYTPVPKGAYLKEGYYYYTSDTGGGESQANGSEIANGSNYYTRNLTKVPKGTTLTAGDTYYHSSGVTFTATASQTADDDCFSPTPTVVPAGTILKTGQTYYTDSGCTTVASICSYDASNCFKAVFTEIIVSVETKLTAGDIYYTDSGGDGQFTADGTETEGTYYDEADVWEIVWDNNLGNYSNCFRLRKFKTFSKPVYVGWDKTGNYPLKGNTTEAVRLSTIELPMMYYTYYIVDSSNRIAVKATEEQITGTTLNYDAIPEIIRSPFLKVLKEGTLTFKTYRTSDLSALGVGMTINLDDGNFDVISSANTKESEPWRNHIFVSYDTSKLAALDTYPLIDDNAHASADKNFKFYVLLNNEYIYYDSTGKINSSSSIPSENFSSYQWVLGGGDPYAMSIRNLGSNKYVTIADGSDTDTEPDWADGTISWSDTAPASRYIIKSSTQEHTYEVMAATGVAVDGSSKIDAANSVDASTLYYNIGRVKTDNVVEVKMYSNATYETGYAQLRFQLVPIEAHEVTYHLIDKFNKDLLQVKARQAAEEAPRLPAQYWSPLVEKYHYYVKAKFNVHDGDDNTANTADDIFILKSDHEEEITKIQLTEGASPTYAEHIYVTYDPNDIVDMHHTTMYLLKFDQGDQFYQENGSDKLITDAEKADPNISQAVYPYCNGDGTFNVYGQHQYDVQQEGASSTRTRWAWYVESGYTDPYHVKILSRQTEPYDGMDRSAYFRTYKPEDYDKVVTNLDWPNISGELATDYMVLGSVGQYLLVTSYPVDENGNNTIDDGEERYVLDSFEQYWKTYDLIRRDVLKQSKSTYPDLSTDPATVPDMPFVVTGDQATGKTNRTYLTDVMKWHAYSKLARAKRWNGYNAAGEQAKGWEYIEHWFQTVQMGSGYFDLIPTTIDPALILLDQHGWEIMRKPLPSSPDDPTKEAKYDAIRPYDSPMVKEYIFWASAKKRTGFHQYYQLDKRIGGNFTSTSLTNLPPYDSENVLDTKGNLNDQYVTYIVKDEYAQSYIPGQSPQAYPFIIRQGEKYASTDDGITIIKNAVPDPGGSNGMSKFIISNINGFNSVPGSLTLWYVKPNTDIDTEMGYTATNHSWAATAPNAYDSDSPYYNYRAAALIEGSSSDANVVKYGRFTFSNGFDPYNIQISSMNFPNKYFTMQMTGAKVEEGIMLGNYTGTGGSQDILLANKNTSNPVNGTGYDNAVWKMTNQTFMAVQDADGNMQLMPRFDHTLRLSNFETLVTPQAETADPGKLPKTHTELYRPYVYNYRIIDNEGRESLHYQWGGELVPRIPDHFKSPLAKDFKFYATLLDEDKDGIFELSTLNNEITGSLAGAGLTAGGLNSNPVYVRYTYDEEADVQHILHGQWFTMKLDAKDAEYDSGIKTGTKPNAEDLSEQDNYKWHWKFLKNPYSDPDPYAMQVFNRTQTTETSPKVGKPMSSDALPNRTSTTQSVIAAEADGNKFQRFALLSHTNGGYALIAAGSDALIYSFLNGTEMTESTPAVLRLEEEFTSAQGKFASATSSQVLLTDDVRNEYTYHVYTNGENGTNAVKYGVEAISATQTYYAAYENLFKPVLPSEIQSPLLNLDQYLYYEYIPDMGDSKKELKYLYGLYDNDVYVRYTPYNPDVSEYKVPNQRNTPTPSDNNDVVDKGSDSNDSPLRFGEKLLYNIIWYNDAMMKSNGTAIAKDDNKELQYTEKAYQWQFLGDDPYAIQIKNVEKDKFIDSENALSESPEKFMLLKRDDGFTYGMLVKTGDKDAMLSLNEGTLTTQNTTPTKFIIFALSTFKVIYHLVIANIDPDNPSAEQLTEEYYNAHTDYYKSIPYRVETSDGTAYPADYSWKGSEKKWIKGTSKRELGNPNYFLGNLSGYQHDFGPVSLGDALTVPQEFYRPNVVYTFFVGSIYDSDGTTTNEPLINKYTGLEIKSKKMSMDNDLLNKTVHINIVYSFNGNLDSNSGDNFVLSIDENKWYTVETMIDGTPWLAQYTNAWGFELKEGRGSHYTNDYLWTPIGDPYGFQLVNRYMDVNSGTDNLGEKNRAITTIPYKTVVTGEGSTATVSDVSVSAFENGKQIVMGNYKDAGQRVVVPGGVAHPTGGTGTGTDIASSVIYTNSIYELLESSTPGYFRFHPVANYSGTQVYFSPEWADDDRDGVKNRLVRLKTNATEFTFGLSAELMKPYFDRAGYVGGLKKEVYNAATNAALVNAMKADNPTLTFEQLMASQKLVYDYKHNIVPFTTGYYRMHSPLGISNIDPVRYVSGYTHDIEAGYTDTYGTTHKAIPMHFYEENSEQVRNFTDLKTGFTESHATRGDILILPVERDPASIFYFEKIATGDVPLSVPEADKDRYNLATISTQGLYVKGEKGKVTVSNGTVKDDDPNIETSGERPAAIMTTDPSETTKLFIMDLGGGVLLLHDNVTDLGRRYLKYFSFDNSNDTEGHSTIYDMKLTNHTHTDHAKLCMQPVQQSATVGVNEMGLRLNLNNGGDGHYYSTFYAPYDVLLTDAKKDTAYIVELWDNEIIHLKRVGKYNTEENGCPTKYKGNSQFVPAGTPVIIRSTNTSVTMALPTTTPTSPITNNKLSGTYLEQKLDMNGHRIYSFGLPFKDSPTKVTEDNDFANNGKITIVLPQKEEKGVGFYTNANPNREEGAAQGEWTRNNWYVYNNRAYYVYTPSSSGARPLTQAADFIPVVFDDDDDEDDNPIAEEWQRQRVADNRVYDLQGRCVASGAEVLNGTWHRRVAPGVYVLNGRKIRL